jgi:hypothetical protein
MAEPDYLILPHMFPPTRHSTAKANIFSFLPLPDYCDAGYTCSSTVGKCSLSGGSLTGDDDSSTSSTATSTYNYGYTSPTSTSDLLNNAPTAAATTTDSLGSSSTGVSQVSDSGSDGNVLRVGVRGFLVVAAAGVGALVL